MYIVSFIYDEEKMAVTLYNVPHSNSKHTAFEFHPSRPYFARYYTIFSFSIHFGYKNTSFQLYNLYVYYLLKLYLCLLGHSKSIVLLRQNEKDGILHGIGFQKHSGNRHATG